MRRPSKRPRAQGCPKLRVEELDPNSLQTYANNARKHSPRQIQQLTASISTFGFVAPALSPAASSGPPTAIAGRVISIPCFLNRPASAPSQAVLCHVASNPVAGADRPQRCQRPLSPGWKRGSDGGRTSSQQFAAGKLGKIAPWHVRGPEQAVRPDTAALYHRRETSGGDLPSPNYLD
jgi:hypothetical protein